MQAWDMLSARYTHCWLESLELRDGEMVYIRIIENVGKKIKIGLALNESIYMV